MKLSKDEMIGLMGGMGAIAKVEIAKALEPLTQRLAALETENKLLREAITTLRDADNLTPDSLRARYDALRIQ